MKEKYQIFKVKARKALNQNENTIIFIGLILMGFGLYIINEKNNNPDVSKFDSEVWGTVSDWYMVIVTLITAIFLYKTLKSQKDVQKEQNRLFKIEEFKYLRSIKPKIKVEAVNFKFHQSETDTHIKALEVEFHVESDKDVMLGNMALSSSSARLRSVPKYLLKKGIIFLLKDIHDYNNELEMFEPLTVEINYEDIDGNKYLLKKSWLLFDDKTKDTSRVDPINLYEHTSDELIETMY